MSEKKDEELATVKAKIGVDFVVHEHGISLHYEQKEATLTWATVARQIVKRGVWPQLLEALGTEGRIRKENPSSSPH